MFGMGIKCEGIKSMIQPCSINNKKTWDIKKVVKVSCQNSGVNEHL